jgi:acyl carrier protein
MTFRPRNRFQSISDRARPACTITAKQLNTRAVPAWSIAARGGSTRCTHRNARIIDTHWSRSSVNLHAMAIDNRGSCTQCIQTTRTESSRESKMENGIQKNANGSIENTILKIVQGVLKFPPDRIQATTDLRDLPGVESIKILRIVANVEKELGIRLDDQVVFRVNTIEGLAREVSKLVEGQ